VRGSDECSNVGKRYLFSAATEEDYIYTLNESVHHLNLPQLTLINHDGG
jgi:hypothetical protein